MAMADFEGGATQAYPVQLPTDDTIPATQAYAAEGAQENGSKEGGEGGAATEEPAKKKRGKPKDELAPPKPQNAYQKISAEARKRLKEEKPELATDLKAMGLALKEAWDNVPQEEKDRLTKQYEEEMVIWRPKWAVYKETQHYKDFFEVKQDWIDARMRKKLVKNLNKDMPKRPKSSYMLFAGEVRERISKAVFESGGGMGDIGKKIAEEWVAVSQEKKDALSQTSAEDKKVFDVKIVEYKKGQAWDHYCEEKAKLEAKQSLKKLIRTKLDGAPKKAPSAAALYRAEIMTKVAEENKELSPRDLGKKLTQMWVELPEAEKATYVQQSERKKLEYEKTLASFKKSEVYTKFLLERQQVKARENRTLCYRAYPKRPPSAFNMYAVEHKAEVEPGKGEGKGRDALMKKYVVVSEEEKAKYLEKEQELRAKWMEEVQHFKEGESLTTFKAVDQKIKLEFMGEAMKVLTLRFLEDGPQPPPKSGFMVYVADRRKAAEEAGEPPKTKRERIEEMQRFKKEWAAVDLQTKYNFDVQKKEREAKWKEDCKEFMERDRWREYVAECKRLKVKVQSIMFDKKKVVKKLKNGMSILPLPEKPETLPIMPPTAVRLFAKEKMSEVQDKKELPELWRNLPEEQKNQYIERTEEQVKKYKEEMKEFTMSAEGKTYYQQVKSISRRNRVARAKNAFLTDMPKKPPKPLMVFFKANVKDVKKENPQTKGIDLRKLLLDKWQNMDETEKANIMEKAQNEEKEFLENMAEFKKSENWLKFKRTVMVKKKIKKKGLLMLRPQAPEGMPKKPLDAFKAYCKENAGAGKSLGELAKMFRELDAEERAEKNREFSEAMDKYTNDLAEYNTTPEGRKYNARIAAFEKKKRVTFARLKFLKDEPKRPLTAYLQFAIDKRPEIAEKFPDVKGIAATQAKIAELWKELSDEERETFAEKEREAKTAYEQAREEFEKTPGYKKYTAIVSRLGRKPGAKAKAKTRGIPLPPAPESMPKKPASGFFLFLSEQRKAGNAGGNMQLTESWRNLGAEGQKKYMDEAAEQLAQYEKDMKDFQKSADGKRYLRLKLAADKKNRIMQAKTKFLGSAGAPQEPKRPQSSYFLFIADKRATLPPGKISENAKVLTDMWKECSPEERKVYDDKHTELKEQYEKDYAEYKNSDNYKKYDRALKTITKKVVKPKMKPGGKGAGRGRGRGDSKPAVDSDSDSDVMGTDNDNSSSSDSDTD